MASGPLQNEVLKSYDADGFVIARGMFSSEEIGLLRRAAREDRELDQHSYGRGDGEGGTVRLSLWNHPGDTIYGMFARSESIVNSAEKILGGEVYHYHSKMIMKDAREKVLERVYVEMDPGDVLFFHANLLHRSDQNNSDNPRWALICCYNAARNNPYKEHHHPRYTPLSKVPDSAILEAGMRRFSDSASDVAWMKTEDDRSASSLVDSAAERTGR